MTGGVSPSFNFRPEPCPRLLCGSSQSWSLDLSPPVTGFLWPGLPAVCWRKLCNNCIFSVIQTRSFPGPCMCCPAPVATEAAATAQPVRLTHPLAARMFVPLVGPVPARSVVCLAIADEGSDLPSSQLLCRQQPALSREEAVRMVRVEDCLSPCNGSLDRAPRHWVPYPGPSGGHGASGDSQEGARPPSLCMGTGDRMLVCRGAVHHRFRAASGDSAHEMSAACPLPAPR